MSSFNQTPLTRRGVMLTGLAAGLTVSTNAAFAAQNADRAVRAPAMKERNPEWSDFIGPGPGNPLGTHALYLSWQYYRVHGTNDTRKIGRRSSNGCIGLYNEQIAELFELAKIGTQVKMI